MLRKEDVKVGMRVNPKDLDNIFYTLVILADFVDSIGTVVYIGEPNTKEATDIYNTLDNICTVYNNDEEASLDE